MTPLPSPAVVQVVEQHPFAAGAFDGWGGAVIGALVSLVVAFVVLRKTLAHDREQARVARQSSAFGDVLVAVQGLIDEQASIETVTRTVARVLIRAEIWSMYCLPTEAPFARSFKEAFDRSTDALLAAMRVRPVNRVAINGPLDDIADIAVKARVWHTASEERAGVEAWFEEFLRTHIASS